MRHFVSKNEPNFTMIIPRLTSLHVSESFSSSKSFTPIHVPVHGYSRPLPPGLSFPGDQSHASESSSSSARFHRLQKHEIFSPINDQLRTLSESAIHPESFRGQLSTVHFPRAF